MRVFDFGLEPKENKNMKNIDFNRLLSSRNKKLKKSGPENSGARAEKEKSAIIIPFHAMLKNELKLYRGKSKSARLGVLRKYDELIAMARKSRT
jgi:hypothetical protein